MEQHKTLLIIVSIAIVLAAIIGVGIWLFYPRDAEPDATDPGLPAASRGLEWEPTDYLLDDGEMPGLEPDSETAPEPDEFEVTYGVVEDAPEVGPGTRPSAAAGTTGTETARDGAAASAPAATGAAGETAAPTARVQVETVSEPAVVSASRPATSEPTAATPPPATQPTASRSGAGSTPSAATSAAVPPARTEPATTDRSYWVQVISSPNRDTVEQAQLTLREHQLGSRILTKEISGTTYFRLRLGPFAVRTEAEKFLGWVMEIDGFADSMIFVDYRTTVKAAESS